MVEAALPITLSGQPIQTVFDLLGKNENDLTYALGWGLAQSPRLIQSLLSELFGDGAGAPMSVSLQQSGRDGGYTDIEILGVDSHVIIEAKRGWVLPTAGQLERYSPRLSGSRGILLAISQCSPAHAKRHLPSDIMGVVVVHRSWNEMATLVERQSRTGSHAHRRLLKELLGYLRGIVMVQTNTSNWTYVVSLSTTTPPEWSMSYLDVVLERDKYFHPYGPGAGWPRVPPNYLAFRWHSKVRQVRHVETFTVIDDLNEVFEEIPAGMTNRAHIVYSLGPAVVLDPPLAVGARLRNARRWVALDLLFSASSLQDAIDKTKARKAAQPDEPT